MANTDGEINIKTKLDTDGVQKDLKGLTSKITGGAQAFSALGGVVTGVTMGLKAANKVIKETTTAVNAQIKAEKQLEIAAKNNPYLNSYNVNNLKAYAGELQKVGTVGDEVIIPLMAQLATTGRTEAEIQNIMSAALDLSASGMLSLDAAVTQLNASFSGNVGTLGRQISELKGLTAEELKSGKAVEIVAAKYKGMAAETAAATGSLEQMKNAQGDFNEALGKITKPTSDLWNNFWRGWYERGIETVNKIENWLDKNITGKNLAGNLESTYNEIVKAGGNQIRFLRDTFNGLSDDNLKALEAYYSQQKTLTKEQKLFVEWIEKEKTRRQEVAEMQKAADQAAAARREKEQKEKERNDAAQKIINENEAALNKELERIKLTAKLKGEEADEQEILNAYLQAYIDLVTTSDLVTENNPYSKKRLEELQNYAKGIQNLNIDTSELVETIKEFLGAGEDNTKLSEVIDTTITQLAQQRYALEETSEAWQKYTDKITELEALKTEVVKKEEETQKQKAIDTAAAIVDSVSNYIGQFTDIVNQVTQIAAKNSEMETQSALTDLSDQYNDGLISYEEYCDKKGEINKKAALEEYKVNMWAWTASILTATANIASGVASCLAEPGIPTALKYVNMALVATSGAAQIASIVAAKPKRPSFYDGGFIGGMNGASYGADNTVINARRGELVVNARQQAQMWKMLNGGGGGGVSLNVDIINNMGDSAKVTSQLTGNGLRVTVDKLVKAGLQDGRYNSSLDAAENYKTGVTLL